MHFQRLDKRLQEAVKALTADAEFQKRFNDDEVLNRLDDEKFNPALCFSELCSAAGIPVLIEGEHYSPVKLLQYAYMWCIDSPLAKETGKEVTELDLDIFFYTLEHKPDSDAGTTALKAFGEVKRRGLSIEKASSIANALIGIAFQPLRMFPSTSATVVGSQQPSFDADWLTGMVAKVSAVTGLKPDEVMSGLSLTACCLYYIQWCRMQGVQSISKRTSEEILKAQSERTDELIADRPIEKGVLRAEDRQSFLETVRTPPEE